MKHILVWYQHLQDRAWAISDNPEQIVQFEGDVQTLAGKLYRYGIENDVAELAIEVNGAGFALNDALIQLQYPRLVRHRRMSNEVESNYRAMAAKLAEAVA